MSTHLTRDERLERQELDDGDGDDDVYVRDGAKVTRYHGDADCRCLRPPHETVTRRGA